VNFFSLSPSAAKLRAVGEGGSNTRSGFETGEGEPWNESLSPLPPSLRSGTLSRKGRGEVRVVHRRVDVPQFFSELHTPLVSLKQSTGVDEPIASKRCS
jgi:hypothetical protein